MNSTDWIFDFSLQAQLAAGKKRFNLDVNCQSQARRLAIIPVPCLPSSARPAPAKV